MLSRCASLSALELGKEIHWDVISCGFMSDVYAGNSLVDVYVKCGSREFARDLFDKRPQWDAVYWNTLIAGYSHTGFVDEDWRCLRKCLNGMWYRGIRWLQDMPVIGVLTKPRGCFAWYASETGFSGIACLQGIHKMGLLKGPWNSWKCRTKFGSAEYEDCWICTEWASRESAEALSTDEIGDCKFSAQKFVSVFLACAFLAALGQGGEFHAEVVRGGFQYNVIVGCAVMDMYANVKYRDCPPYVRQNASTRFGVMDSDDRRICHEWLWQRGHWCHLSVIQV